jgi:predicted aminopeptidase
MAAMRPPAFFRPLAVLPALLPLAGCYLLQAAGGQLDLNARRVPLERIIAAPATPPPLRAQLELVRRARDFATRELGLPDNGSYRAYADVGRPYVVWNVFATPEFSVEPRTWCFPIAGCSAYRGYFAEARARAFARGLEARGDDVLVGGVPAYSTLGHFADPVLNTMLGWSEEELVAIIFHELAHQRLYVRDDSAFNEAFATVVEGEGLRRWLEAEGRSEALAEFRRRQERYAEVAALVAEARTRLRQLYAESLPRELVRERKAAEFVRLRAAYEERRARWGAGGYEWLFGPAMNNASLLAVATYRECVPGLEQRLAAAGGDLGRFYAAVGALARLAPAARHAAACAAQRPSVSAETATSLSSSPRRSTREVSSLSVTVGAPLKTSVSVTWLTTVAAEPSAASVTRTSLSA